MIQYFNRHSVSTCGYRFFEPHVPSGFYRSIEMLGVSDRLPLMLALPWWVDHGSERLMKLCVETDLWCTLLTCDVSLVPAWYDQAVQRLYTLDETDFVT